MAECLLERLQELGNNSQISISMLNLNLGNYSKLSNFQGNKLTITAPGCLFYRYCDRVSFGETTGIRLYLSNSITF